MTVAGGVQGAEQITALAARFKREGNGAARREILRGIRVAARPAAERARESARSTLPRAGGLNELIASEQIGVRTSLSPKGATVKIMARGHDYRIDRLGRVRHRTFGHKPWVNQQVTPGWFTRPIEGLTPEIRNEISRAVDDIARRLTA